MKNGGVVEIGSFSDADFRRAIVRALRLMIVIAVVAAPVVWWKMGPGSAGMLLVGAVVSWSGVYEWQRLIAAVMERMDRGGRVRPMGMVLVGFFLRLGLTIALLYASLKFLSGSILALAAGLALGVFALLVESLRLVRSWTV
jgi:hypothetical protein